MSFIQTFQTFSSTLKYIIIGALIILGFIGISKIQSCSGPKFNPPKEVIEQNKTLLPVSPDLLKDLPNGVVAVGAIVDKNVSQDPSKTIQTTHVLTKDSLGAIKYTDITQIKARYGFVLEPKFYVGYSDSLTAGLGVAVIRLNKVTVDCLVSYPAVGIGTSYQLTNNTFIGLAATGKYFQNSEFISPTNGILPLAYLGGRF